MDAAYTSFIPRTKDKVNSNSPSFRNRFDFGAVRVPFGTKLHVIFRPSVEIYCLNLKSDRKLSC